MPYTYNVAKSVLQISFSYSSWEGSSNVLAVDGPWDEEEDPTRFYSLHCLLFPRVPWCLEAAKSTKRD